MIGFPGETEAEAAETIRQARRLQLLGAKISILAPHRGSALGDRWGEHSANRLPDKVLRRLQRRGMLRQYGRPLNLFSLATGVLRHPESAAVVARKARAVLW